MPKKDDFLNSPHPNPLPQGEREYLSTPTRILIAEIGAAHGIRGLVKLRIYCDDLDLIDGHGPLFTHETNDKTLGVTLDKPAGTTWLARIDGIDDRTAAEKLRGTKLYIDRDTLPVIEDDGEYYYEDLVGCDVITDGAKIGTIISVQNFGASDLIEVKPTSGSSFYVPFTETFVPSVDMDSRTVTIQNYQEFLPDITHKKS